MANFIVSGCGVGVGQWPCAEVVRECGGVEELFVTGEQFIQVLLEDT